MNEFSMEYNYNTVLYDAFLPAFEGFSRLSTSISEVESQFNLLYGVDANFNDFLSFYNKSKEQFIKDVIKEYRAFKKTFKITVDS